MLTGKTYSVDAGCDLVINPTDYAINAARCNLNMGAGSKYYRHLGTLV